MKIAVKDGYVVGVAYKGTVSVMGGETIEVTDDTIIFVGEAWPPVATTDVGNGNPPPPT